MSVSSYLLLPSPPMDPSPAPNTKLVHLNRVLLASNQTITIRLNVTCFILRLCHFISQIHTGHDASFSCIFSITVPRWSLYNWLRWCRTRLLESCWWRTWDQELKCLIFVIIVCDIVCKHIQSGKVSLWVVLRHEEHF